MLEPKINKQTNNKTSQIKNNRSLNADFPFVVFCVVWWGHLHVVQITCSTDCQMSHKTCLEPGLRDKPHAHRVDL